MIYGRKQWGKSTLASQYPNSIDFMFEPGRKGLPILQVPTREMSQEGFKWTWQAAQDYRDLFLEEKSLHCLILDTIDVLYDKCLTTTCLGLSDGKHDSPMKFGQEGPGVWGIIKANFEGFFHPIIGANKIFVVLSHDRKVEQKDRDGAVWSRIEPSCPPASWKIAQSMCDFVFHTEFVGGNRIINVRDLDNTTLASCNPEIDCFLDPDGKELRRFVVPNDKSKVYSALHDAFSNKLHDYDYTPDVQLPTKTKPSSNGTGAAKSGATKFTKAVGAAVGGLPRKK
jgi:hypothetical protein